MEKNSKGNIKRLGKFILILLLFVLVIAILFIGYKLYIFTLVNKVYDSYYEFLEKDNIHLEAKSTSSAYDGEFVYYELYRNDGKEIITERSKLSNVYEHTQVHYRDLSSGDTITQSDMKGWDNILNKDVAQPTNYSISDGRFETSYSTFLPIIIRELEYFKNENYTISDKLNIVKYYLNVSLKDINDNGCIVLEFLEGETRETIWINKKDYKIVKIENDIIKEIYDENSNVTMEKINMKSVFTMDENVVRDEDIKWIDLTGKTVTILD